jgi:hypothetical protein
MQSNSGASQTGDSARAEEQHGVGSSSGEYYSQWGQALNERDRPVLL